MTRDAAKTISGFRFMPGGKAQSRFTAVKGRELYTQKKQLLKSEPYVCVQE